MYCPSSEAATNGGGVSLLIDEPPGDSSGGRKKFVSFQIAAGGENNTANAVNRILFDAENRLWCITDGGLYRAAKTEITADYEFEKLAEGRQPTISNGVLRDSRGRLWFGIVSAAASRLDPSLAVGRSISRANAIAVLAGSGKGRVSTSANTPSRANT